MNEIAVEVVLQAHPTVGEGPVWDKRKKRFYRLSADGQTVLARLAQEWAALNAAIADILKEGP